MSDWFSLEELAQRIGGLVWVEEQLFEVLGRWSVTERDHRASIAFSVTSRHHGWHAEMLRRCLPTSEQLAASSLVTPPTTGWQRAVEAMRGFDGDDATDARLVSQVRVVDPWLARETGSLIELANPTSDAATTRWLRFVEIDHHDDGFHAAELLDELHANTVSFSSRAAVASLDLR